MHSIRNILRQLKMIDGEAELRDTYTAVSGTFARSDAGGFFVGHAEPGETCKEGDLIAHIAQEIDLGDGELVVSHGGSRPI